MSLLLNAMHVENGDLFIMRHIVGHEAPDLTNTIQCNAILRKKVTEGPNCLVFYDTLKAEYEELAITDSDESIVCRALVLPMNG